MKFVAALFLTVFLFTSFVPGGMDDLPINKLQLIGSHNSYKRSIDAPLFRLIRNADSALARHIDYSHVGLSEQLSLGLCNLEIDVYADAKGGKYAHPKGLDWEDSAHHTADPSMLEPGFKVFHIQDIDFRSNCPTFRNCLQELKQWSDSHKDHYPVFITMNAKDEVINKPGFTVPEKFTEAVFDQLDSTILADLGASNLVTPDNVRGSFNTLEEAVLKGHWPLLKNARGKFIFVLDETGAKRDAYIRDHPSLKKRVLFVNAQPGTPEAAICIINDAIKDLNTIQGLVKKGYIVRTRADADTEEARRNDKHRFEIACSSGAQIITTDYYYPSTHFVSDYVVNFGKGKYIRKNPVK